MAWHFVAGHANGVPSLLQGRRYDLSPVLQYALAASACLYDTHKMLREMIYLRHNLPN